MKRKLSIRLILCTLLLILFSLGSVVTSYAAEEGYNEDGTIKEGYHLYYHNDGNPYEWGNESIKDVCTNYVHETENGQPCYHYLKAEVYTLHSKSNELDLPCTDGTTWHIPYYRLWCGYLKPNYSSITYTYTTEPESVKPSNSNYLWVDSGVLNIRVYKFVSSNPYCDASDVGKYLKGTCYYRYMSGSSEYGFVNCNMPYPTIGGSSYQVISDRDDYKDRYKYFAGYNNLSGEQKNSRGYYPTFDCAINNVASRGFAGYDSAGKPIFETRWDGYEWSSHTHLYYRYKCKGHVEPIKYKIEYDLDGGEGYVVGQECEYFKKYQVNGLGTALKKGYIFKGWYSEDLNKVLQPGDEIYNWTINHGKVYKLKAIWEAGKYKVHIHINNPDPTKYSFTTNTPTGWQKVSDGVYKSEFTYGEDTLPISKSLFISDMWTARPGYYSTPKSGGQATGTYYNDGMNYVYTSSGDTVHLYISWKSAKIPLVATDHGNETVDLDWSEYSGENTDVFLAYQSASGNSGWDKVKITTDQVSSDGANAVSMQSIFSTWGRIGVGGNWYVSGNALYNSVNQDYFSGFYNTDPDLQYVTDISMSYTSSPMNGDDDIIGCLIKANVSGDYVSGYMVISDNGGNFGGLQVLRLDNVRLSGYSTWYGHDTGTVRLLGSTSAGMWSGTTKYDVSCTENATITVKKNGVTVLSCRDTYANPYLTGTIGLVNESQPLYFSQCSYSYQRYIKVRNVNVIAPDLAKPNTPVISGYNSNILKIHSDDNGTPYYYKAEAYHKNFLKSPICYSNIDTVTISQGIKGYYYYLDNSETGYDSRCVYYRNANSLGCFDFNINSDNPSRYKYLHILAVDKAKSANKSGVLTVELPENRVYTITFDAEGGKNKVNNQEIYSKTVDWNFKGWSSNKCTTGCSHISGSFNHYDNTDRCLTNCVCKTWDEVKYNSDIKTTGNLIMRAHYAGGKTTLEVAEKPGYVFIGWFNKPIVGVQLQQGTLRYGGGENWDYSRESLHTINSNMTLYAYYNRKPIFADVYDGMFFEGQNVTYSDLLSLISAFDYEDDYYNAAIQMIFDLPEVKESDIYIPIHISGSDDNHMSNDNIHGEMPGYVFDSEHWIDNGNGTYKNKLTGKVYYTVEKKMELEDQINASDLVLKIESIEYHIKNGVVEDDFVQVNGIIPDSDWENKIRLKNYYLDTSTDRIDMSKIENDNIGSYKDAVGTFTIEYTVTDNGYTCGGDLVGNPVTLNYSRVCQIQYNNYPVLYLRNMAILKGDENIKEKQLVLDAEDCVNNPPWWYLSASENPTGVNPKVGYTFDNLQNSVEEVGIYNVKLNTYLPVDVKWSDVNQAVQDWSVGKKSQDILELKGNSEEFITGITKDQIYNAILSYNVEFDCTDQFGKKASGNIDDSKYLGNQDVKPDVDSTVWHQSKEERSIIVYIVNSEKDIAMMPASIIENLRYISKDFINTLSNSSYWASSGYGKEVLDEILKMYENEDKVPDKYLGLYNNAGQNKKVQIGISDYTK